MRKNFFYLFTLLCLCLPVNSSKVKAQEILQKETTRESSQMRPDTDKPTEVAVGLYLIDFDNFDEKQESFKLDGYLFLTWKDKRLAFNPGKTGSNTKVYKIGETWLPQVIFFNVETGRETAYTELKVKSNGTVYYKERFTSQFNSEMNLKRFPFDSQKLKLTLESLDDSGNIAFVVDKSKIGKSRDAFLTGWRIGENRAVATVKKSEIEEAYFPEFVYEISIFRLYSPYIWNIFIPLLFIIGISWTVFWSKSFESNSVISFSSLLSAIAFNIVIAEELPKVSYLTFINGFILIGYIFICLSIVQIVIKHCLEIEKKRELSMEVDRTARWLFPTMFGVANIILIAIFLL